MKLGLLPLILIAAQSWAGTPSEIMPKQFLKYAYGDDGIPIEKICQPNDDVWMLRGERNPAGIQAVDSEPISIGDPGIYARVVGRDFCVVEVRQGKVDPSFNLEMVYQNHRQIILRFLYASLLQDSEAIARLVTKPENVSFGNFRPAPLGDMDVYEGVLAMLPIVRVSAPASDKASKSITYRLPLTDQGFAVRLLRDGNAWKIDTNGKIEVPLAFFYQRNRSGRRME